MTFYNIASISLQVVVIYFLLFQRFVFAQNGLVFSPFIEESDTIYATKYSKDDVKTMLKVIVNGGYQQISTYYLGVPTTEAEYVKNVTWMNCSSTVHTAVAAAEINLEQGKNVLRVFQGIAYMNSTSSPIDEIEVEVGLEVAKRANDIFANTVAGIIFPGRLWIHPQMWADEKLVNLMHKVADYAKANNINFGLRIGSNCKLLFGTDTGEYAARLIRKINFIICRYQPTDNNGNHAVFFNGPEDYFGYVSQEFSFAIDAVKNSGPGKAIKMILETGWPGSSTGPTNTDVWNEKKYWKLVRDSKFDSFTYAFDALVDERSSADLLTYYGKWRVLRTNYNGSDSNKKFDFEEKFSYEEEEGGLSVQMILFISGVGFLTVAVLALLAYVIRLKKSKSETNTMSKEEIRQFLYGLVGQRKAGTIHDNGLMSMEWEYRPYDRSLEIGKDDIQLEKDGQLGYGVFGCVHKGKIKGSPQFVALKTLHSNPRLSAVRGILSEIKILTYLGKHDNIVCIRGAYTAELEFGKVYLATEYCENGSLEKFLRENKTIYKPDKLINYVCVQETTKYAELVLGIGYSAKQTEISDLNLLRWSIEIASAMEFITSKNVIHGDLATRNVLLNSQLTAKVADFGLSRRLYEYEQYVKRSQEPLPWRWMAIESLRNLEFSAKSDVWSFGVTLWEIFSFADIPYPGFFWDAEFVSQLERGMRLDIPTRANSALYNIMRACWTLEPRERPNFDVIKGSLINSYDLSKFKRCSM